MTTIDLNDLVATNADDGFGITTDGFVPKPVSRLLEEKVALARALFGDDIDLTSGSTLRKLVEMMCVEEARAWDHLAASYADSFVVTASGDALSMLGAELGVSRPHHRATGKVRVKVDGDFPASVASIPIHHGTRLLTPGGHDYFVTDAAELTEAVTSVTVSVTAFPPGPEMNLDAASPNQIIDSFHDDDDRSAVARNLNLQAVDAGEPPLVVIEHTQQTSGGEQYWADEPYRDLLLAFPRNLWTPDAIRVAVARVPGVRQVIVSDRYGGLDINQSIFGNFNFVERLFSEERSLGEPYYFTVLVAPGEGAIWSGDGQLRERVSEAIDAVRPIGIRPKIEQAGVVSIGLAGSLRVDGVPIPGGTPTAVNASVEAVALRGRILDRVRRYVSGLRIGEPVRHAEIVWALMEEPGVIDAREVRLRRSPGRIEAMSGDVEQFGPEEDVSIAPTEIGELVESLCELVIS